jgi:hypothetical protein
MVNIPRLVDAVEKVAWRHGVVNGKNVTHGVEPDGSHVITIRVPEILIDPDSLPKKKAQRADKMVLGPSTPEMKKGSKR